jgi:S1-C subfamily serine protease
MRFHCLFALSWIARTLPVAGAFAAPYNNNPKNRSGLNSLSVTELKRLLNERNIDFRDCLEKRDLIERLESSGPISQQTLESFTKLTSEETRLIETFKRVSPAVAYISTSNSAVGANNPRGLSLRSDQVPLGAGSGFLWDNHGHVVTNCHVVTAGQRGGVLPSTVKVKLQGSSESYDATVVGIEPEKDIAVLKLPKRNLPRPLDVGISNDLQVGQHVLAIGNPFGLDNTLTTGVISALGRDMNGFGGRIIKGCIQTDGECFPVSCMVLRSLSVSFIKHLFLHHR